MSDKILFIFEGEKTEKTFCKLLKHYINNSILEVSFCGNIYDFYELLNGEDGEYQEVIPLLKERTGNENIKKYSRDDFGNVYLFFDYDSHSTSFDIDKISRLVNYFDNETEHGKLFISYPMIESLKHIHDINNIEDFISSKYNCQEGKKYKEHVNSNHAAVIHNSLSAKNPTQEYFEVWDKIVEFHCCKANYIINGRSDYPQELLRQAEILDQQYLVSESNQGSIYTLSSFPLVLLDYFGCHTLKEKIVNSTKGHNA